MFVVVVDTHPIPPSFLESTTTTTDQSVTKFLSFWKWCLFLTFIFLLSKKNMMASSNVKYLALCLIALGLAELGMAVSVFYFCFYLQWRLLNSGYYHDHFCGFWLSVRKLKSYHENKLFRGENCSSLNKSLLNFGNLEAISVQPWHHKIKSVGAVPTYRPNKN